MFKRIIELPKNYSFFLFGARGTGKTTLLKQFFGSNDTYYMDLLDYKLETRLLQDPGLFHEIMDGLSENIKWVIIDEVQKLPFLLNEVHRQIESNKNRYFVLTGSSARKLRRGQANLLAGRAFSLSLFPLTTFELQDKLDIDSALNYGTLPQLYQFDNKEDIKSFLRSYTETYVKQEIQQEGVVRNLISFRQFLPIAATENGQILSYSNLAREVGVDIKTIKSYFEILEDTLLGFFLFPYAKSIRKRQMKHPKFYFFDTGVRRALADELSLEITPKITQYGRAFEHFLISEIYRMNVYLNKDYKLSYFATSDIEIDLVIEKPGGESIFIEFKSSDTINSNHVKNLASIVGSVKNARGLLVCRETIRRKSSNILILPWQEMLVEIGLK